MRGSKAIAAVAAAATSLAVAAAGIAAAGAGAATPARRAAPASAAQTAKAMEARAVSSAEAALKAAAHLRSKAARAEAEAAAVQNLEAAVKAGMAGVKPKPSALAAMRSAATRRAEKLLRRPGSLATRRTVRRPGLETASMAAAYGSGFAWSGNWSGYVDTNESYDYVLGEWTVPSANCGPWYDFNFSQSSTWVGIDGWGSSTVEQLGSATGCVFGASTYYAWTEMYPQIEDPIFEPISPGDQIIALTYAYGNGTDYELWMADLSEGWSYVRYASTSSPLSDSSAEWITERPSCGPPCDNLTNFGTTTFTDAYAIGNNTFGAINAFPNYFVDMWNSPNYDAVVGGLGAGGTQFTDWWEHS